MESAKRAICLVALSAVSSAAMAQPAISVKYRVQDGTNGKQLGAVQITSDKLHVLIEVTDYSLAGDSTSDTYASTDYAVDFVEKTTTDDRFIVQRANQIVLRRPQSIDPGWLMPLIPGDLLAPSSVKGDAGHFLAANYDSKPTALQGWLPAQLVAGSPSRPETLDTNLDIPHFRSRWKFTDYVTFSGFTYPSLISNSETHGGSLNDARLWTLVSANNVSSVPSLDSLIQEGAEVSQPLDDNRSLIFYYRKGVPILDQAADKSDPKRWIQKVPKVTRSSALEWVVVFLVATTGITFYFRSRKAKRP